MTDLLIDGLATHRLVRLLHKDEITDDARASLIGWTLKNGHTRLRYLIQCRYCLGVWCAAFVVGLRFVKGGRQVRDLLAFAGVSALLYDLLEPSPS